MKLNPQIIKLLTHGYNDLAEKKMLKESSAFFRQALEQFRSGYVGNELDLVMRAINEKDSSSIKLFMYIIMASDTLSNFAGSCELYRVKLFIKIVVVQANNDIKSLWGEDFSNKFREHLAQYIVEKLSESNSIYQDLIGYLMNAIRHREVVRLKHHIPGPDDEMQDFIEMQDLAGIDADVFHTYCLLDTKAAYETIPSEGI